MWNRKRKKGKPTYNCFLGSLDLTISNAESKFSGTSNCGSFHNFMVSQSWMCTCAVAMLVTSLLDPFYYLLGGCRPVGFVIHVSAWYTDLYPQNSLISAHHLLSFQAMFQDYSDILMFAKLHLSGKAINLYVYFPSILKRIETQMLVFQVVTFSCSIGL